MKCTDKKIIIAMAIGHLRNGDTESAKIELENNNLSLHSIPKDELIDRGIIAKDKLRYQDALLCFDAAGDVELLYELGDLCIERGFSTIARRCYITAIGISHHGEEDSSSILP